MGVADISIGLRDLESFRDRLTIKSIPSSEYNNGIISVNDIKVAKTGSATIVYNGSEFDCHIRTSDIKKLYIFFNGALGGGKIIPPMYRLSYENVVDGYYINIGDPMYKKFKNVGLRKGWYYLYYEDIANMILDISSNLGIDIQDVYLYGSSAGGTCACVVGNILKNVNVIAINPILILKELNYFVKEFTRDTGIDLKEDRYLDIIESISSNKETKFLLCFNSKSEMDSESFHKLENKLKIKLNYGINNMESGMVWIYDRDGDETVPAHSKQENKLVYLVIEYLSEKLRYGEKKIDKTPFTVITEFWKNID